MTYLCNSPYSRADIVYRSALRNIGSEVDFAETAGDRVLGTGRGVGDERGAGPGPGGARDAISGTKKMLDMLCLVRMGVADGIGVAVVMLIAEGVLRREGMERAGCWRAERPKVGWVWTEASNARAPVAGLIVRCLDAKSDCAATSQDSLQVIDAEQRGCTPGRR
jgi:hypothetical protein